MQTIGGYKDSYNSLINGLPAGMYYYLFEAEDMEKLGDIIGNNNAVQSVYYAPFFPKGDDTKIKLIEYDDSRFGGHFKGRLKRVIDFKPEQSILKTNIKYEFDISDGPRHYSQESRLLYEPYVTYYFDDGINNPWELETSHIINKDIEFISSFMVTDGGYYKIYLKPDYKGDKEGRYECLENTSNLEIPCSSSAYVRWSSTQKAQSNQTFLNNYNSLANATTNTAEQIALNKRHNVINTGIQAGQDLFGGLMAPPQGSNLIEMGANAIGNGIKGAVNSGITVGRGLMQNSQLNLQGTINNRNFATMQRAILGSKSALQKDLSNTPRTMLNTSSDILGGLMTGKALKCSLRAYGLTEEYKEKLGDYFAQYGYKQNRLINLEYCMLNRRDYNYIKTVGANITSKPDGIQIPKDHLNALQNIFNEGVTVWHLHRNGGKFQNYEFNNLEVW